MPSFSVILTVVRRYKWRVGIGAAVALLILWIGWSVTRPAKPEYVTAEAVRGDLVQTVEAVGTVISDRDLNLQFPVSGIVENVYVKEGDQVKKGQKLVALRAGNLSAAVASAAASVQQANAQLQLLQEGTRPEDIVIAEAELQNKRASLAAAQASLKSAEESLATAQAKLTTLRKEADTSLAGDVASAGSTVQAQMVQAHSSLAIIDDVFDDVDVQDVVLKHDPSSVTFLRERQRVANTLIEGILASDLTPNTYEDALQLLTEAHRSAQLTAEVLTRAYDIITGLPITGSFTYAVRESHKSTLTTEKTTMQTSVSTLQTQLNSLRNASANLDTKIATEESNVVSAQGAKEKAQADINTYQTAVQISQAQLELKRAGSRPADIDAARAKVQAARADLARAQAQFNDTILTAPIDGVITKVNLKAGESLSTSYQSDAPVTMLGASPYRVEMFVAEIDIPRVQLSQSGSIELDAFRNRPFPLTLSEIDPVATDRDGVPKYRVKLDFTTEREGVRVGMTGDAEIDTGFRGDVVSVPLRAVLDRPDGTHYVRVLNEDNSIEERTVTTGMEGAGGQLEVDGVEGGETIVVLIRQ